MFKYFARIKICLSQKQVKICFQDKQIADTQHTTELVFKLLECNSWYVTGNSAIIQKRKNRFSCRNCLSVITDLTDSERQQPPAG